MRCFAVAEYHLISLSQVDLPTVLLSTIEDTVSKSLSFRRHRF